MSEVWVIAGLIAVIVLIVLILTAQIFSELPDSEE